MGLFDILADTLVLGIGIRIIDKSIEPIKEDSKLIDKDRESLFDFKR